MEKTIYLTEEERFPYKEYRWNAFLKYNGRRFRFTVAFSKTGVFIRVSELTESGWNVVADEWCLHLTNISSKNPYAGSNELKRYTRKRIEQAMLEFMQDIYGNEQDACDEDINERRKLLDAMEPVEDEREKREQEIRKKYGWNEPQHGMSEAEIENYYF